MPHAADAGSTALMEIKGAIDRITVEADGRVILAGWAMAGAPDRHDPVDTILLQGVDRAQLRFFSRPDFGDGDNRFGFGLGLESRADLFRLFRGESAAFAVHKGARYRLPFWPELDAQMAGLIGEAERAETSSDEVLLAQLLDRLRPAFPVPARETASHEIEVGFTSYDRAVIVGRDGHLFLLGGSNAVESLYAMEQPGPLIEAWLQVMQARAERFAAAGISFVQMLLPEKQSVLREAFPHDIAAPNPPVRGILAAVSAEPWFLDGVGLLRRSIERDGIDPFRKIDTHLSFLGARALAVALIERAGGDPAAIAPAPLAESWRAGDLGNKIGLGTLMERVPWPVLADWPFAQVRVETVRAIDPADGGHGGVIREWRCATPLIDKTLLIFGNSFFGRDEDPCALSWWMARSFRRVVFHWSAHVDWATVEAEKPDLVICQTIERFLRGVPAS